MKLPNDMHEILLNMKNLEQQDIGDPTRRKALSSIASIAIASQAGVVAGSLIAAPTATAAATRITDIYSSKQKVLVASGSRTSGGEKYEFVYYKCTNGATIHWVGVRKGSKGSYSALRINNEAKTKSDVVTLVANVVFDALGVTYDAYSASSEVQSDSGNKEIIDYNEGNLRKLEDTPASWGLSATGTSEHIYYSIKVSTTVFMDAVSYFSKTGQKYFLKYRYKKWTPSDGFIPKAATAVSGEAREKILAQIAKVNNKRSNVQITYTTTVAGLGIAAGIVIGGSVLTSSSDPDDIPIWSTAFGIGALVMGSIVVGGAAVCIASGDLTEAAAVLEALLERYYAP